MFSTQRKYLKNDDKIDDHLVVRSVNFKGMINKYKKYRIATTRYIYITYLHHS